MSKSLGGLCIPSPAVVQLPVVTAAERVFRRLQPTVVTTHNAETFVVNSIRQDICHSLNLPQCHDLPNLLLFRYVRLRLHALAASLSKKTHPQFASKSAASRTVIK